MSRNKALIIGSSSGMWQDLDAFEKLFSYKDFDIALINYSACFFLREKATYLITLHPELANHFKRLRLNRSEECLTVIANHAEIGVDIVHEMDNQQYGFSGYYAARVLLERGYNKIIMAGCPCDNSGHWYDDPLMLSKGKHAMHGEQPVLSQVDHYKDLLYNKLKSMSGKTAEIFGIPNQDWVKSEV